MPSRDIQHVAVSTGTLIRFLLLLFAIGIIYFIADILKALFFAVIVASAIEPAIVWLIQRRVPRILGIIFIYLLFGAGVFLFVYLLFPLLLDDLASLTEKYPLIEQQVLLGLKHPSLLFLSPLFEGGVEGPFRFLQDYLKEFGSGVFSFASAVFGGALSFFLVLIFSVYLAAQEKGIETFLRLITPLAHESYVIDLWERSQKKLGRWFRTQLLLGAIVGVLIFFGLTFLDVPQAFFLAIIAGLFEIIPIVGPILAAVPGVGVAFLSSPSLGLLTIVLYVAVQQLESHVIVPVVMRKTVGLSPLVVVLALLVGGKLGGVFGILLSVPITVVLAELINDWDKKKRALIPE
jgi:predicted PurR-regulated permease PerM